MIEHHQAVVKADMTIRQFEVVDCAPGKFGLRKIFQVVSPEPEATAQREREIDFIEQFKPGHQAVEDVPGAAKFNFGFRISDFGLDFTARTEGPEGKKRIRRDQRITSRW